MARVSIRWKLLIVFTLLFTVVFALSFLWFYQFATTLAMDDLRGDLVGAAITAAGDIDPEEHAALYASGEEDDETYSRIASRLREVGEANPKVEAIYTMVRSADPNTLMFVVSGDENQETRAGLRESYDVSEFPQMIAAFDGPTADQEIAIDKWGAWFSGYAPIVDRGGQADGIVGIDMNAQDVIDTQTRIRQASTFAFAVTYVSLFLAVFLISFNVTRPLQQITGEAQTLERGDRYSSGRLAKVASGSDEIAQLARVFDRMAVEVQAREDKLRQQVVALRIEIDQAKREQQVAEVTETDYFQALQASAERMRTRAKAKQGGTNA